jgi:hypothetical protein
MAITALPVPPSSTDNSNYATRGDLFLAALPSFVTEVNSLETDVITKRNNISAEAADAEASELVSNAEVTKALDFSNEALDYGSGISDDINAAVWVSSTNYSVNDIVYSPLTTQLYRCIIAGVSTIDPSLDSTAWRLRLLDISTGHPTVFPVLNLDFINSQTVDPRVTFTRASSATRVNQVGLIEVVDVNTPRIDYDPSALVCKGLLIEESKTNLLLRSEEFNNSSWTTSSFSISTTSDLITAPNGAISADKLIPNNGVNQSITTVNSYIRQDISKSAVSTTYSFSAFFKAGEFNAVRLYFRDSATSANFVAVTVSLTDGSILSATSVSGSFTSASTSVHSFTSDWYRISLTFTSSTETAIRFQISPTDSVITTADGVSGIYIWGAQLEVGVSSTSYIPTTTAATTRAADVATISGTNFSSWYKQSEGTLVTGFTSIGAMSANKAVVSLNDASSANYISIGTRNTSSSFGMQNRVSSGSIASIGSFGASNTSINLAALAYKALQYSGAFNASIIATDTTVSVPTVTRLKIGGIDSENVSQHVRFIRYYNTRLPDAQLQAITQQ